MQAILILACLILSISGVAAASIVGSRHDFFALNPQVSISNSAGNFLPAGDDIVETCVFCHAPHNASVAGYRWNRTNPSATGYTMYTNSAITMITIAASTRDHRLCV